MNTLDIALAIITDETRKRVLISLRLPNTHLGNMWEFPGGKIETGEKPAAAAIREALEECGVEILAIEPWDIVEHIYPDRAVRLHPFLCSIMSGEPRPVGNAQIRWADIAELDQYAFPPANESIIKRIKSIEL